MIEIPPLCQFCGGEAMQEILRVHVPIGDVDRVLYQCQKCQRASSQDEPAR